MKQKQMQKLIFFFFLMPVEGEGIGKVRCVINMSDDVVSVIPRPVSSHC